MLEGPRLFPILVLATLCVAAVSTFLLVLLAIGLPLSVGALTGIGTSVQRPTTAEVFIQGFFNDSYVVAPVSWAALCAAWIWRGKHRSRWNSSGFTEDSFDLLLKMKGGPTRLKLLNALVAPRDRSQLAQEMGMDWKSVDRHVQLLLRYSFIKEVQSFGSVKVYSLTSEGDKLLNLVKEMMMDEQSNASNIGPSNNQIPSKVQ